MTKLVKKLKADIAKFQKTGRLPREAMPVYRKEGDVEGLDHDRFPAPSPSAAAVRMADAWPDVLKAMSPVRSRVYQLHLVGGLSQSETAVILGVSQRTVSYHVAGIRKEAKSVLMGV